VDATPALVEIVADGGHAVGFGHLGRCLAIAESLGEQAAFTLGDPDALAFVRSRGARSGGAEAAPVVLIDRREPTPAERVRVLQAAGRRVALLDDRGPARRLADLVIDPPTAAGWPPAGDRRLAGFEHALVRAEIVTARDARDAAGARDAGAAGEDVVAGRVLLGIGGSDPAGLTVPLAAALADLDLEVNRGPGYRGAPPAHGRLLGSPAEWIGALARASLVVCGFGHSLLEAACLGVPAISVVFIPEHVEHARAFARAGTALTIDMTDGPRPDTLATLAHELLGDRERLATMGARGRALVDGRGAERVALALRAMATPAAVAS
jgi:spore coat polysaccharide biosynthesis predicted glycosyltransferase SpsG